MVDALGCLARIRVGRNNRGEPALNKPCLLLAIICEIQAGHIASSLIAINSRLISRYYDLYELLTGERQKANPWLPLWHLRNDKGPSGPLWSPQYANGIAPLAGQLGQPKSLNQLLERFSSARLDPALLSSLKDSQTTEEAYALLTSRYLPSDRPTHARLQEYLQAAQAAGEYEQHPERLVGSVRDKRQLYARSAAFRTLVLEACDYRCAASRLRYITPDYRYLVEAAHLIPFSVSQDDRPINGLALTPNLHWAMDNHLIAPGPDQRWHVSPAVDTLVSDNRWLCDIGGTPLVLPKDPQWHPCPDALARRLDHLQQ